MEFLMSLRPSPAWAETAVTDASTIFKRLSGFIEWFRFSGVKNLLNGKSGFNFALGFHGSVAYTCGEVARNNCQGPSLLTMAQV